ncbi:putative holin-like toxin [Gemella morbillorum]|nr:putative holin-like toxin [Gemella morbillorum]
MSAYEIVQTIIGINLLIVTMIGVCITAFKNDNKK